MSHSEHQVGEPMEFRSSFQKKEIPENRRDTVLVPEAEVELPHAQKTQTFAEALDKVNQACRVQDREWRATEATTLQEAQKKLVEAQEQMQQIVSGELTTLPYADAQDDIAYWQAVSDILEATALSPDGILLNPDPLNDRYPLSTYELGDDSIRPSYLHAYNIATYTGEIVTHARKAKDNV